MFAVMASGTSLAYQRSRNGATITGATGASYQTVTLSRERALKREPRSTTSHAALSRQAKAAAARRRRASK